MSLNTIAIHCFLSSASTELPSQVLKPHRPSDSCAERLPLGTDLHQGPGTARLKVDAVTAELADPSIRRRSHAQQTLHSMQVCSATGPAPTGPDSYPTRCVAALPSLVRLEYT